MEDRLYRWRAPLGYPFLPSHSFRVFRHHDRVCVVKEGGSHEEKYVCRLIACVDVYRRRRGSAAGAVQRDRRHHGHWHIISNNVDANKKLFLGMGAKMFEVNGNPLMMFPGVYINLNLGQEKGEGGTVGSVVNHVGFIVNNVQEQVAKWKAAGVPVLPGTNNRPDQAFVVTPDGVRIEILEDKTQAVPVKNEHVHLFVPESDIPKAQAWYAKTFGGTAGTRNNAAVVDGIPGVQIRFAKADTAQAPTRHRILDHIGFDVKDHAAFVKKLEADGIKLDEPPRQATPASNKITYITDPWGTRIEIIERAPLGTPVN
jgi:catechol 2,3-dioxygenase-like lactoylglutathione lyase family enzyme